MSDAFAIPSQGCRQNFIARISNQRSDDLSTPDASIV